MTQERDPSKSINDTRSLPVKPMEDESISFDNSPASKRAVPPAAPASQINEFEIRSVLGKGGFGIVYLAYDTILQREVAIKIPHVSNADAARNAKAYLHEARAIAQLDHPHILPVYQASTSSEVPFFIVTKLIDGAHLGTWLRDQRPGFMHIASMTAQIAEALAYAHAHGVVHRDVKPSNVLVDKMGRPYVADFGLALCDADPDVGPAYVGTLTYMSPEQARGEGHRVDGRSDIFSLGIVLYQLLTGHRPFRADNTRQLLRAIQLNEPENPCSFNSDLPRELARICLRAMAKSIHDRYQRADELAKDLLDFASGPSQPEHGSQKTVSDIVVPPTDSGSATRPDTRSSVRSDASEGMSVVPKSLRPFDASDAASFLQLLPGPYDQRGVPESLRFWKTRIESRLPQEAFSVGVIYGPSGCGKTSMFRAGLKPLLSPQIDCIYIEASDTATEKSLLSSLSAALDIPKRILGSEPNTDEDLLVRVFTWLRRNSPRKVVLCIDQFEQWLFSHASRIDGSSLVDALRQCDGINLQAILMVRDDFWMGITRLMQALDLEISENHNASSVDLFTKKHARHVLMLFGQAYGQLPKLASNVSQRENRFLDAAVDYVAVDGRVICVQLAIFAEMIKHREWNDSSILTNDHRAGLGFQFLDQTFDATSAPRKYHVHADGARRVLRCLLPSTGAKIKGSIRSEESLREAAGYHDEKSFHALLRILDSELHLITPSDREVKDEDSHAAAEPARSTDAGYQLTHDFLIAAVRYWLDKHQLGTRRGQAQLRLEEFTELYRNRPTWQSLPTLAEYAALRNRLSPKSWTESQRNMMRAARNHHARIVSGWMIVSAAVLSGVLFAWHKLHEYQTYEIAQANVDRLLGAELSEAIAQSVGFRKSGPLVQSLVQSRLDDPNTIADKKARAILAMSHPMPAARQMLFEYLMKSSPDDVSKLCRGIPSDYFPDDATLLKQWRMESLGANERLRLACLMAHLPSLHHHVIADKERVVRLLLAENPIVVNQWIVGFEVIGSELLDAIQDAYRSIADQSGFSTLNAANFLARYAAGNPSLLASQLTRSGSTGYGPLLEALKKHEASIEVLRQLPLLNDAGWSPSGPDTDWWNLGFGNASGVAPISLEWASQLQQSGAIANEHYVIAPHVRPDELEKWSDAADQHGYRIAGLSPHRVGESVGWMVYWKRDQRKSRFVLEASSETLRQVHQTYRNDGLFAEDVVAYSKNSGESFVYACIWTDGPPFPGVLESDMYIAIPAPNHQRDGWEPLLSRGFIPRANVLVHDRGGEECFSSVRWRLDRSVSPTDGWNMSTDEFRNRATWQETFLVQARLGARPLDHPDRGMMELDWSGLPLQTQFIDYCDWNKHQLSAASYARQSYRPWSVHSTNTSDAGTAMYSSVWYRPIPTAESESEKSRRQVRVAMAKLELGDDAPARLILSSQTDAESRGLMIDFFSRYGVSPTWLTNQLKLSTDAAFLRAAVQALSLYKLVALPESARRGVESWLADESIRIDDPGLRSAMQSLKRAWNLECEIYTPPNSQREISNSLGMRLIRIEPPASIWMGSHENEPKRDGRQETRHQVRIRHPYWMAALETTLRDYQQFQPAATCPKDYTPSDDCPMVAINWFEAAKFCRWLSEREGMDESQMCYPPIDSIVPGMRLPENYMDRTGYRLPSDAEWEFAARGGYELGRHFGFADELLNNYAWTAKNSDFEGHPVGGLLSNDYGLFDALGNAMEWCQDRYELNTSQGTGPRDDPAREIRIVEGGRRMNTRGAAMLFQPQDARAPHRNDHGAEQNRIYLSFRIARTIR